MQALRDLLSLDRLTSIVDVGASPVDGSPPYQRMLEEGLCTVVGFEPNPSALADLNGSKTSNETYLPYVIGTGTSATFHNCRAHGMSGLLEPDPARLALFPNFEVFGTVNNSEPVATRKLDAVHEIAVIDYLKLDVQGGELLILRGADKKLTQTVAIQTEVSFAPLYRNQPPFGRIDMELRWRGFVPHCFVGAKLWPVATTTELPVNDPHQIIDADMLYLRDFADQANMSVAQWKQLAMVAHHIAGSYDVAMRCVEVLARHGHLAGDAPQAYASILKEAA